MATKLKDRESIREILGEMTVEEKARLVTGGSSFGTVSMEKYGIPAALLIDAGGGVNLRQYLSNLLNTGVLKARNGIDGSMGTLSNLVYLMDHMEEPEKLDENERELLENFLIYLRKFVPCGDMPSCFPVNSLLASTWNPETILETGRQVGKEASAFGVDMLLGTPCINIQRDPRGGRGFECYSEDPYLISQLAYHYCLGVQEQGVVADVKHFAVNNQETNRQTIDVKISERAMREIYLPGFQACVQKGGVKNVMTSYNWIHGVAAAHNQWLIQDVLRGEWGFDGFVVSDWGGVYDQVKALKAGNDLCMPGPRSVECIVEAVQNGRLEEKKLDEAVENFLKVLLEMPVMKGRKYTDIDSEEARKAAYRAAAEGIVLLKNEGVLPLKETQGISFFGAYSKRFVESGVGSGRVHTNKTSSLIETAGKIAGRDRVYVDEIGEHTAAVVYTLFSAGQEGADRESLQIASRDKEEFLELAREAHGKGIPAILVLNIAGPVELLELAHHADAILLVYFPGQEGAHVVGDMLYGRVNPSGKLAQTFPRHLYDCPAYDNFPGENETVTYGEGIFVGYRYYDRHRIEPLYPFGYGLSYTTFALSGLRLSGEEFPYECGTFTVCVDITNTGDRAGAETIQLYLRDEVSVQMKPEKELKAFQKVFLEPGETKTVTLTLTRESLSSFDEELGKWVCEPGYFTVLVGTSSRNLPLSARFQAVGENPYAYGAETEYKKIARTPQALKVLLDTIPEEILSEEQVKRQTAYIAFRFTLKEAFETYVAPKLESKEAKELFGLLCKRLRQLDAAENRYKEEEVF